MALGTVKLMKKNRVRDIACSLLVGILAASVFPASSQSFFDPCDGKRARSAEPEARSLLADKTDLRDKKAARELFRRYWMAKSYRPYNIDKCFELAWANAAKHHNFEQDNKIDLNSLGKPVDVSRSLPWKTGSAQATDKINQNSSTSKLQTRQIVRDKLAPKFRLPHSLVANGSSLQINGHVSDDSRLARLTANGKEFEVDTGGNFQVSVYVPVSGTEVLFRATDEWNNSALHQVVIKREKIEPDTRTSFPALDPRNVEVPLKPNAVALIIGIENYKNFPDAQFANRDAQVFYDYANRALGVPKKRIMLLVDKNATETNIKKALKHWLPSIVKANKSEVFVFFAGHGLASSNDSGVYLLPVDGDPDLLSDSAVSKNELLKLVSQTSPKRATIFLDTCYSGLSRTSEALIASARGIMVVHREIDTNLTDITVLSASSGSEISYSLPEAKHGLFSYYLMKGLEGEADKNGDNQITSSELLRFVKTNVEKQAAASGRKQTPNIEGVSEVVLSSW